MKKDVGIILVNFSGTKDTLECLDSLKKVKSQYSKQIYVVHFEANEGLVKVQQHSLKPKVIVAHKNLGFGGMCNLGIQKSLTDGVDYIMLLNNDTVVAEDFLDPLIKQVEKKEVGYVSPLIYFYPGQEYHLESYTKKDQGKVIWYGGGAIDWNNFIMFHKHVDEVDRGHVTGIMKTDFSTGCCLLCKASLVNEFGLLPEKYFMYMEDVAWSTTAAQKGYTNYIVPTSKVWHKNAQSSGGAGSGLHQYYQTRNRILFVKEFGSLSQKFAIMKYAGLQYPKETSVVMKQALKDGILGKQGQQ